MTGIGAPQNRAEARSTIDSALSGGTPLNPITKADVASVVKLLGSASPADAKALIADMARSAKLAVFAQELTDTKWVAGGLNQGEQAAFFGQMARKLDAGSLSQLYGALVSADKSNADYSAVYGLTHAISKNAAPQPQLDFLRTNAPRITAGETLITSTIGGVTAKYGFDPTAYTSAVLISKLPPAFVGPAIASLTDPQLAQIVRSGIGAETYTPPMGGGMVQSWDPKNLIGVLNNATTISDPVQRTRLVTAATGEFFNMLNAKSSFGFTIAGQAQTVTALRNAIAGVSGRSDLPSEAAKAAPTDAELILHITQMSLDIVGIFDQTGASDAANGLISLGRSDWAGAALSGLALVPIVGALAVAGKLGRWGDTIVAVANKAATDPAFRATVEPALRRIQAGLDMAGDQIAKLSDSAKATVATIRAKLDEVLGPGAGKTVQADNLHLREPEANFAGQIGGYDADLIRASGLSGLSPAQTLEIKHIDKGSRPAPSTYMSRAAIEKHLDVFRSEGAIRITTTTDIARFDSIGQANGGFVMAKADFDALVNRTGGDKALMEKALGLESGRLSNGDTIIAWIEPQDFNGLKMPTGNEGSANPSWIPGGFTSGGYREAVINMSTSTPYTPIILGK
jgi:hypothetical protein